MKRFHLRWPSQSIFIEFFSVLLAVFMAFMLNEWREVRKNRQLAETALQGVGDELKANLDFLKYNAPFHKEISKSLEDKSEAGTETLINAEEFRLFEPGIPLNMLRMKETAWIAANEMQAMSHVDYDLVKALYGIYSYQKEYNLLIESFFNNLFNNTDFYNSEKNFQVLFLLTTMFQNITMMEDNLINMYEKSIIDIRKYSGVRDNKGN